MAGGRSCGAVKYRSLLDLRRVKQQEEVIFSLSKRLQWGFEASISFTLFSCSLMCPWCRHLWCLKPGLWFAWGDCVICGPSTTWRAPPSDPNYGTAEYVEQRTRISFDKIHRFLLSVLRLYFAFYPPVQFWPGWTKFVRYPFNVKKDAWLFSFWFKLSRLTNVVFFSYCPFPVRFLARLWCVVHVNC